MILISDDLNEKNSDAKIYRQYVYKIYIIDNISTI